MSSPPKSLFAKVFAFLTSFGLATFTLSGLLLITFLGTLEQAEYGLVASQAPRTRASGERSAGGATTTGFRFYVNGYNTTDGKLILETANGTQFANVSSAAGAVAFDVIIGLSGANIVDLIAHRLLQPLNHTERAARETKKQQSA